MPVYCPKCKSPMTIRNGREVPENKFYGCTKYPKCNGIREIDEVVPASALTCNKDINQKIVSNLHKVVKRFR